MPDPKINLDLSGYKEKPSSSKINLDLSGYKEDTLKKKEISTVDSAPTSQPSNLGGMTDLSGIASPKVSTPSVLTEQGKESYVKPIKLLKAPQEDRKIKNIESDGSFLGDLGAMFLKSANSKETDENLKAFRKLPTEEVVQAVDYVGDKLPDRVKNAWVKGKIQGQIANTLYTGAEPDENSLIKIAELNQQSDLIPESEESKKLNSEYGISWALKNPLQGSKALGEIILSSLSSQFEASKRTTGGAVAIGAAAGSVVPFVGTAAGAASGFTAGQIAAGFNLSTSGKILEVLTDLKIDIKDPNSLIEAFKNPEIIDKARDLAIKRSIPIAILDLLTAGIAGKVGGATAITKVGKIAKGLSVAGIEAAGGSLGELGGQLAAGEKINKNSTLLEGIAELGSGAPALISETASTVLSRNKTSTSDVNIRKQVSTDPKTAVVEVKQNLDKQLQVGLISQEDYDSGIKTLEVTVAKNEKIPEVIDGDIREKTIELIENRDAKQDYIAELESRKENVDVAFHPMIDDNIRGEIQNIELINNQIADLSKQQIETKNQEANAIQEPSTESQVSPVGEAGQVIPEGSEGVGQSIQGTEVTEEGKPTETLKDVESTTKALKELSNSQMLEIPYTSGIDRGDRRNVAEAYHEAKADGSNPELVKAIEDLLAPKAEVTTQAPPQQTVEQLREQEQVENSEIEKRRKEELDSKDNYEYPEGNTTIPKEAWKDVIEEDKKIINAKFDSERQKIYDKYDKLITPLIRAEAKPQTIAEAVIPEATKAPVLSKLDTAKERMAAAKAKLNASKTKFGISGIDSEQKAKDLIEYHKAIVEVAKEYIADAVNNGITTAKQFAKEIGETFSKNLNDAWEEANGRLEPKTLESFTPKEKKTVATEQPKTESNFVKKLSDDISSADVSESMSNITTYSDREVSPEQLEYNAVKNEVAIKHGRDIIDEAKKEFGDNYVNDVLNHVNNNVMPNDIKALTLISLENDLHKRLLEEPQNEIKISKQLKKVENATIKHLRESARGTQYGVFRQISRVGYDVDQVTNSMFTKEQSRSKDKVKKTVEEVTPSDIQKQAEEREQSNEFENVVIERPTGSKLKEAQLELQKAKDDFKKAIRRSMGQASSGGNLNVIAEATNLMRAYAKLGIVKIDDVLKEVAKDFGEKFTSTNEEVLREAHKEANKPKTKEQLTPEELLQKAKDNIKERIAEKEQNIADKEVEIKVRGKKFTEDAEYKSLKRELSELAKLEKEYLTPESKALLDERKKNTIATKLENEIADLDKQIASEQKTAVEKKQPLTNDKIEGLKADKKARVEFLQQIDPNTKDFVKQALVDAGFSKEINVTRNGVKEKRSILDWNQLSTDGISTIRDVVEKALAENTDLSEAKKNLMINQLENEYVSLQADIIEKGINELNRGNEVQSSTSTKTLATRLAEMYNKGLFDKAPDTYDYLINKTFGTSIKDQELFFKIKDLARTLSLANDFKAGDNRLSDVSKSTISQQVKEQIKDLLQLAVARQALGEGFAGKAFLASEIAKQLMGSSQRQLLVSLKQAVENPISNYINDIDIKLQDLFKKEKWDTKELTQARVSLARTIYNDTLFHGGTEYGGTGNAFVSKNAIEDYVSNLSKNEIYQIAINLASGKPFLDSADSAFKIKRTELEFTHNLLRILTDKSNKNRMTPDEALAYVSESLTGQSLDDATKIANNLVDHINSTIGRQIVSDRATNVRRIANDIMKDGLVNGGKLTVEEVKAAFDAAYVTAGAGIGHEANNIISRGVSLLNKELQSKLDKAVKDKEWGTAAMLNATLILQRNFLTPFVGGGTNWTMIGLQRIGLPTQFFNPNSYGNKTIDLSSKEGMNTLSKTLERKAVLQRANGRTLIGLAAQLSLLAAAGVIFAGDDDEDREKVMKWMKDHPQITKYSEVITPFSLQMYFSKDSDEMMKNMLSAIGSRYGYRDDATKLIDASKGVYQGLANDDSYKTNKGAAAFGEYLGGKMNLPYAPTRFYKNVADLAKEIGGKPNPYIKSTGFISGFSKNGLGDILGFKDAGGSADILLSLDNKSLELMKSKNYELKSKDWGEMKTIDPKLGAERTATKPERDIWNKEYNNFVSIYLDEKSEYLQNLSEDSFKEKLSYIKQYANAYAKYKSTKYVGNIFEYTEQGITKKTDKAQQNEIMLVYNDELIKSLDKLEEKADTFSEEKRIPFSLALKIMRVNIRSSALEKAKNKVLKQE